MRRSLQPEGPTFGFILELRRGFEGSAILMSDGRAPSELFQFQDATGRLMPKRIILLSSLLPTTASRRIRPFHPGRMPIYRRQSRQALADAVDWALLSGFI